MARSKNQYEYEQFMSNCTYEEFCLYESEKDFAPSKTYQEMQQFRLSQQLKKESQLPDLLFLDDGDKVVEIYR